MNKGSATVKKYQIIYAEGIMESKKKCRVCSEKIHYLDSASGRTGTKQCINHQCRMYGKIQ